MYRKTSTFLEGQQHEIKYVRTQQFKKRSCCQRYYKTLKLEINKLKKPHKIGLLLSNQLFAGRN